MYVPRGKLLALISIVVAAALVTGSGAFTSASVDRTATVKVTGDESAYLGLKDEGENSHIAKIGDDGRLDLDFTRATDYGGKGVNPGSQYTFDGVFTIANQGTQEVTVNVGEGKEKAITFYRSDGESLPATLGPGDSLKVGVEIDASNKGVGDDFSETFTITAESDKPGKTVLDNSSSEE